MKTQKMMLNGIGIVLLLVGGVWLLQGTNILPGSYMSGNPQWAINGTITLLIGIGFLWFANRKSK
jgi:hypothetical protein